MDFELPADLTTITPDELDSLEATATEAFDQIAESPEGEADLTTMSELADAIDAIRTERGRREVAAEQIVAQAEELLKRVHVDADAEVEADASTEGEVVEAEGTVEAEAEVVEADAAAEAEPELVTAAATPRRIPLRRAQRQPVVEESGPQAVITAAADIPGFSAGAHFGDRVELAKAMTAKARTLSNHSDNVPVATFDLGLTDWIDSETDAEATEALLSKVADPQSLVAAGEWCSPSEHIYEYLGVEGTDGLLDLPTFGVRRGGVQVPTPLLLPANLADITFTYTETIRGAAGTKECVAVPCPTWSDVRLEADGICITAGNLTERTNPELIARYITLVGAGHLHKMSGKRITSMVSASTDGGTQPNVGSATSDILSGVALLATRYRSLYKTSENMVLEAVLPFWAKEAIRADMAARKGVATLAISDAEIMSHFSARNIRPQFVMDWQALANATAWPTACAYMVYAAGAWAVGSAGTLDLGVVRDSTLNATNDYTAAWTEEFTLLVNRLPSLKGTVTINVDGITAPEPVA